VARAVAAHRHGEDLAGPRAGFEDDHRGRVPIAQERWGVRPSRALKCDGVSAAATSTRSAMPVAMNRPRNIEGRQEAGALGTNVEAADGAATERGLQQAGPNPERTCRGVGGEDEEIESVAVSPRAAIALAAARAASAVGPSPSGLSRRSRPRDQRLTKASSMPNSVAMAPSPTMAAGSSSSIAVIATLRTLAASSGFP